MNASADEGLKHIRRGVQHLHRLAGRQGGFVRMVIEQRRDHHFQRGLVWNVVNPNDLYYNNSIREKVEYKVLIAAKALNNDIDMKIHMIFTCVVWLKWSYNVETPTDKKNNRTLSSESRPVTHVQGYQGF